MTQGVCKDPIRREEIKRQQRERMIGNTYGVGVSHSEEWKNNIRIRVKKWHEQQTEEEKQVLIDRMTGNELTLGRIRPESEKQSISKKMKGVQNSLGYIHPPEDNIAKSKKMKGKRNALGSTHTQEWKDANSIRNSKEKHWNWKGGISAHPYCGLFDNEFREGARCFVDHTCQICGHVWQPGEPRLAVHHLYENKESCCNEIDEGRFIYTPKGGTESMIIEGDPNKFLVVCSSRGGGSCHAKFNCKPKKRIELARKYEKLINESFDGRSYYSHEELDAMKAAHITPPPYYQYIPPD